METLVVKAACSNRGVRQGFGSGMGRGWVCVCGGGGGGRGGDDGSHCGSGRWWWVAGLPLTRDCQRVDSGLVCFLDPARPCLRNLVSV